ncbi:electron transfer flavoprotein subunit beta/FixA family protein [Desulfobacterales bacterium HSG17]|nr:electron transfer flavoprotein subunit beta/FixA family protein [Desulfobacterales bacterium HSG17]
MKILICIKQINASGEINLFDAHALEEAVRLKQEFETCGNKDFCSVDVVTVGPPESSKIIRRAFGMGADKGYHIVTKDIAYGFSFEIASKLAVIATKTSYDLILTGIMSQDFMSGQTGPMLAEILDLPCVTGVIKTNLTNDSYSIEVEQEMENGFRNCLEVTLPALLTIQAGINTPGYPTLSRMLAAGNKEIITFREAELFPENLEPFQARETYVSMEDPQKTRTGHVLKGSITDKAHQLFTILQKKALV